MNTRHKAFSVVELLTVITIISLLLGLTIPALQTARMRMRVTAERANLRMIDFALEKFADELGFYPPSTPRPQLRMMQQPPDVNASWDQGAHILYESLLGLDNLGYQKDHFYYTHPMTGQPLAPGPSSPIPVATKRYEHNIQTESIHIGNLIDITIPVPDTYGNRGWGPGWSLNDNPVFLDKLDVDNPRPILYYRANKNRTLLRDPTPPGDAIEPIYEYRDNERITRYSPAFDPGKPDNGQNLSAREYFFQYIHDPQTGGGVFTNADARPYRKDSFILIGAGPDGMFGPNPRDNYRIDDITNFERR
ncbi:MAG: hypothetical protein AMJ79_07860 [Phycisphaerae bacterium SM23_30]|nr:MAG: hypothetical protein AMJ79_07860 [Phycisphaerae bacterium SM23_30]